MSEATTSDAPAIGHPPAAPSFGSSMLTVTRLQLRRLIRGRKLRLATTAVVVLLAATAAARFAPADEIVGSAETIAANTFESGTRWGIFGLMVFLTPFLFLAGAISEEVEGRTLTFLIARPVDRFALTFGKYLAGTAVVLLVLLPAELLLYVIAFGATPGAFGEHLGELGITLLSLTMLGSTYAAICLFFGALVPEAGGVLSALYLGIVEFLGGMLPGVFRVISMRYLAGEIAGLERGGLFVESAPDITLAMGGAAMALVLLFFLGFTGVLVRTNEYRFGG